jgi:hypothetical protein
VPPRDDDRYDIPEPPTYLRDDYYDILDYGFFKQFEQAADLPRTARKLAGKPKQAENVTPFDEVLDSSWFTNRIGARPVTPDELRHGPNLRPGPDLEAPWTIVAGKTQGVTPGFTIEDGRGDRYVIKFDPLSDPELATGAEAISTKLFWAMGYNVPENYLVSFSPELLRISPQATVKLQLGRKRPMTGADLDVILAKVPKLPDGRIRAIASRFLSGKPKGPIPMLGLRDGDPNDVVRHEHRRELRGYKVFCSWLNHNDSREINTLDMYVEEGGRRFVKHYLIDFGATLGSASTGQNLRSEGYEYIFDLGEMGKSLFTAGLYTRPWTGLRFPVRRGVGRFEAEHFQPAAWKPNYPCPPFENTTPRDGFWAAKIVMRFDDALLRAAVESAEFTDPAASDWVVRTLGERRDRIGRYWFSRVAPLDEFEVRGSGAADGDGRTASAQPAPAAGAADGAQTVLLFADLAVRHGLMPARRYDVLIAGPQGRLASFVTERPEVPLDAVLGALGSPPPDDVEARLVRVTLRASLPDAPVWSPRVDVLLYLMPSGGLRVAAIERDEA